MDNFPADLKQFITDNFSSVAELEALLLLRADPQKSWTAEEASRALYMSAETVALQLTGLQSRGFLKTKQSSPLQYFYEPHTAELQGNTGRLAEAYKERRVSVITLIYSQPLDKVRTFADAFRLRKGP